MASAIVRPSRVAEILERTKPYLYKQGAWSAFLWYLGVKKQDPRICDAIFSLCFAKGISDQERIATLNTVNSALYNPVDGEYYLYLMRFFISQGDQTLKAMLDRRGSRETLRSEYYIRRRDEWLNNLIAQLRQAELIQPKE